MPFALQIFSKIFEIYLHDFRLIVVCCMMNDSIAVVVPDSREVKRTLLVFQKQLNFFDPFDRKHELFLIFVLGHLWNLL